MSCLRCRGAMAPGVIGVCPECTPTPTAIRRIGREPTPQEDTLRRVTEDPYQLDREAMRVMAEETASPITNAQWLSLSVEDREALREHALRRLRAEAAASQP